MQAITGTITSIYRSNGLDGSGSDEQVDFGDDKVKCSISLTDGG